MALPSIEDIKSLAGGVKRDTSEYDARGTVTKVSGTTAYVRIDGSDIETPMDSSCAVVKPGDVVSVHISHGDAHIVGNRTDMALGEDSITRIIAEKGKAIERRMEDVEGNYSTIRQSVEGISTEVSSVSGEVSAMKQSPSGFEWSVASASDVNTAKQAAISAAATDASAKADAAEAAAVQVAADAIKSFVSSAGGTTSYTQTSSGFSWSTTGNMTKVTDSTARTNAASAQTAASSAQTAADVAKEQAASGDELNQLSDLTYKTFNGSATKADDTNGTWYAFPGTRDQYTSDYIPARAGERFHVHAEVKGTAKGASTSGGTDSVFGTPRIALHTVNASKASNSSWPSTSTTQTMSKFDSAGTSVQVIDTVVTLPADKTDTCYFRIAYGSGLWSPYSGTMSVRNLSVKRVDEEAAKTASSFMEYSDGTLTVGNKTGGSWVGTRATLSASNMTIGLPSAQRTVVNANGMDVYNSSNKQVVELNDGKIEIFKDGARWALLGTSSTGDSNVQCVGDAGKLYMFSNKSTSSNAHAGIQYAQGSETGYSIVDIDPSTKAAVLKLAPSGVTISNDGGKVRFSTDTNTDTVANIVTAATNFKVTSARYYQRGKVAQVYIVFTTTNAISSGNITNVAIGTIASGKRPAMMTGFTLYDTGPVIGGGISSSGAITLAATSGSIAAGGTFNIAATYLLA